MKIQNLVSVRSGRAVANQFVAYDDRMTYFQSYESTIAVIDGTSREITIGRDWDYSVTTLKYFYQFLRDYAPVVDFEWNRQKMSELFRDGSFCDPFGRLWFIRFDSSLA